MLAALTVTAVGASIQLPSHAGRVSPTQVARTAPFDNPGLTRVGPGRYEVVMTSQICTFAPGEIRVPAMWGKIIVEPAP
jgi:cytochrome c oxidase subunit 2